MYIIFQKSLYVLLPFRKGKSVTGCVSHTQGAGFFPPTNLHVLILQVIFRLILLHANADVSHLVRKNIAQSTGKYNGCMGVKSSSCVSMVLAIITHPGYFIAHCWGVQGELLFQQWCMNHHRRTRFTQRNYE